MIFFIYSGFLSANDFDERLSKAENGNTSAQVELGRAYEYGFGIEVDKAKALYWYQKAADNKYDEGQFNLAVMFEDLKQLDKAVHWFRLAALQGHRGAQRNLAFYYENGLGLDKNTEKAYLWYLVSQSNSEAERLEKKLTEIVSIKILKEALNLSDYIHLYSCN
jgi:TPR repeat protein